MMPMINAGCLDLQMIFSGPQNYFPLDHPSSFKGGSNYASKAFVISKDLESGLRVIGDRSAPPQMQYKWRGVSQHLSDLRTPDYVF